MRRFGGRKMLFVVGSISLLFATGLPAASAQPGQQASSALPASSSTPSPGPSPVPQPVPSLWNATTRTYAEPDGSFQAQISPDPVNYKAANGSWTPIVDTLVPATASGYAFQNQAGPYSLQLPSRLGVTPVRFQVGASWASFSLQDASASGTISGSTDTFSKVMPGVDVTYESTNDGVQETVHLQSPSAPSSYTYLLRTSSDLTPAQTADGSIAFVDGLGQTRFLVPAPIVQDAAGSIGPASMSLQTTSLGTTITVSVDATWLADPARLFPVTIDPTVTLGPTQQCYIQSAQPSTSACGSLKVAGGSAIDRGLVQFDVSSLPPDSTVTNAQLGLHLGVASSVAASIALHQVTTAWNTTATWNVASTTQKWTTAGGDFASTPAYVNIAVGPTVGTYYWYPTSLVQGWVNGSTTNDGMLLKQTTETTSNLFTFDTPSLTVTYHHWLGQEPYQPFYTHQLTDRMGISVDLADGNLLVRAQDLQIAGTGLDLSINRFYNSAATGTIDVGTQWQLGTGAGVKLNTFADGSVDYRGPDGAHYPFIMNPDGTFASPAGLDATLVLNSNGSYTMTFHADESLYHFSSSGKLTSESDKNGNQITFAYTNTTLNSITDTQGRLTSFTYGANGLISKITDPAGRLYQYGYNAANDLTTYTDPANGVTSYAYDADHSMTQITDPVGNVTKIAYAPGGVSSIICVTNPSAGTGPTTTFTYSPKAPGPGTASVRDSNGHTTSYAFDGFGRETQITDPLGNTASFTYNGDHQVTGATDANTNVYPITYDANNNVVSQKLPTGAFSTWTYTNTAHPWSATSMTDPQGNLTTYGYDTAGDLTSVTDALASNKTATYTYNANGTIATATDAMGHQTSYTYDAKGNLKKVTPPSPLGVIKYTYDSLSRIATMTDGLGHVATVTYDAMDRPTSTTITGGLSVSRTYDKDGNTLTLTDPTGVTTYAYNALNQQTTKTLPAGAGVFTYTWDGEDNLLTLTDGSGTVHYAYNADNLVSSITDPFGGITNISHDANGAETLRTYPNGVALSRTYDASGRLTRIAGGAFANATFQYSYLNAKTDTALRQTVTSAGNTTAYTYDPVNRLLRALTTGTNPSDYQYTYDGVGNRLTQNANGTGTSYTYNAASEMTAAGSTTYTYDANGSRTGSSAGLSLAYNNANQNTSATPPGGSATAMAYSGLGQTTRTSAGGTSFLYSLLGLASETTSGVTTHYVYDPSGGLVEEWTSSANRFYYLFDGLGSVVGLTNGAGSLVNTYTYDPYGNVTASTGTTPNHWKFASGYQDANTGFTKFGDRYYDSGTGVWTQSDPIAANPLQPAIAATFAYAGDNPVNRVDPSGEMPMGSGHPAAHWQPHWTPHWTPHWQPSWHPSWTPRPAPSTADQQTASSPPGSHDGRTTGQRIAAGVMSFIFLLAGEAVFLVTRGTDMADAGEVLSTLYLGGGIWMLALAL